MWDKFVESSQQGTVFSTTKWLNLFDIPYKIIEHEWGGIVGFLTPEFTSGYILTPFQGVLVKNIDGYKECKKLSIYSKLSNYIIDEVPKGTIYNHYTFSDIRSFIWRGWKPDIKYTFVVRPDWDKLEKQTRYEISRYDLPIEHGDVEKLNFLYTETFKRKGMKRPVSEKFVERLCEEMNTEVYTTENSAACLIKDNKRSYYILGASDGTGESSYCLWNAIKDLKEVDLVGCNDEKIAHFKKGFGGKLVPYYGVSL